MSQSSEGCSQCRFCAAPLEQVFADLGSSPLANSYLSPERAGAMEPFYPLRALVCERCFLVQLEEFETPAGDLLRLRVLLLVLRPAGWSTAGATPSR